MMLFIVSVLLIGLHRCQTIALEEGICTGIETKNEPTSHIITSSELEPYLGKCPGYFFRKCILQRFKLVSRIVYDVVPQTQIVRKCCHGYIEMNGVCTPACIDGCVFANCTGPNICTCYDGYVHDTANVCTPKCDNCEHGTCIHPQVCFCDHNYDWDNSINRCVPRCYHSCENGYCSAPNRCDCNDGYTWDAVQNECVPLCNPPCIYGTCIGSHQCKCDFDYQFKNGSLHECEPICEMSCLNAICSEPNVCECFDGFINHDKERPHECHCGKFCIHIDNKCVCLDENQRVKGRILYETNGTNSLKCNENNCVNGNCIIDDADDGGDETKGGSNNKTTGIGVGNRWHCDCNNGFIKYDDFTCVNEENCLEILDDGHCSKWLNNSIPSSNTIICQCINGVCLTNNSCACVGGYRISDENPNKCVPYCSLKCVNGYCSEPDLCECENYQQYRNGYNETDWNICYPICDPDIEEGGGCNNGTCIAPDICQCHRGFELSLESNFTCIPSSYDSDSITGEQQRGHGVIIGCISLFVVLGGTIIAYIIYNKRRRFDWNRSSQNDNYSSEPISFDCSDDF